VAAPRSVRTERDNARARALGYASYYDFRVHGSGRIAPARPITGEALAAARGHRGPADLERDVERGKVVALVFSDPEFGPKGIALIHVTATYADGEQRVFRIRRPDLRILDLTDLGDAASAGGVTTVKGIGSPGRKFAGYLTRDVEEFMDSEGDIE
jgi:hypothetical protein